MPVVALPTLEFEDRMWTVDRRLRQIRSWEFEKVPLTIDFQYEADVDKFEDILEEEGPEAAREYVDAFAVPN
jgi:hypothetical protein